MVHEWLIFMASVGEYTIHENYSDLTNRPKAPKLGSFTLVSGNPKWDPGFFSGDLGEGEIQ